MHKFYNIPTKATAFDISKFWEKVGAAYPKFVPSLVLFKMTMTIFAINIFNF